ncbi:MAG: YcfL family protein [bacterium]
MKSCRERLRLLCCVLLPGAALVLASACASSTTSNVGVGQIVQTDQGEVLQKEYVVKDKSFGKEIQVTDIRARFRGEFLEGQAILANQKKSTVAFEYKFEWFDAEGFPMESLVTLWKPDLLYGKETKTVLAVCPLPHAKGFKVLVRKPNPVEE